MSQRLWKRRRRSPVARPPNLTVEQILAWADEWHERWGRWPGAHSGRIPGTLEVSWTASGLTWAALDAALIVGRRGLPGGSSLAQLFAEHRQVRNPQRLPRLTVKQVLAWADAHYARTGQWPTMQSGPIEGTNGETWSGVENALLRGRRGLQGEASLACFLQDHRGVRNKRALPRLTEEQICAWADAHHQATGTWPKQHSGAIAGAPGETWLTVDAALRSGSRGLSGSSSLAQLLEVCRQVPNDKNLPRLSTKQILGWADAHHQRTGHWPTSKAGPIADSLPTTWAAVSSALIAGVRGLPGGSSLARLLAAERGVRNKKALPPLTTRQILVWAKAHQRHTGLWPTAKSGVIADDAHQTTWLGVDMALRHGNRGLPGGISLHRLLDKYQRRQRRQLS